MNERVQSDFGVHARGMWIAERVWEPGLPRLLREAGITWTILDDVHFKNVGLEDSDLYGYYATEDQSSVLKVYATSQSLALYHSLASCAGNHRKSALPRHT